MKCDANQNKSRQNYISYYNKYIYRYIAIKYQRPGNLIDKTLSKLIRRFCYEKKKN